MELSAKKTLHGERDYLRVALTLRDKLDGLITSRTTNPGIQRKILFDVSHELELVLAHTRLCCEHEQIMNPGLWSTLPMELLQRVFAKLPFPDICRLKSLSKKWQLSLQSSLSEFTLALKESSPRIMARVTPSACSSFWLHVLDGRNNRWHALHVYVPGSPAIRRLIRLPAVERWAHMNGAADAGLVCYVDKSDWWTSIYEMNPMTGVVNRLPDSKVLKYSELTMMRIVVDRNTYHYKVIVVKRVPPVEAEVYDSEVQQWTKPKPSLGRIFGIAHSWSPDAYDPSVWRAREIGPCVYDFRDGKYYAFAQDREKWLGIEVISFTLMKNRLFVLHWDERLDAAFISEYCVSQDATSWVKEKTHSCFPGLSWQPDVPEMISGIHACSGFLFVFQHAGRLVADDPSTKLENGWVYELATLTRQSQPFFTNVMCELHWNIRP